MRRQAQKEQESIVPLKNEEGKPESSGGKGDEPANGTLVTRESFLEWKYLFDMENMTLQAAKKEEVPKEVKLTGEIRF